jgi:hypothetical protein
MTAYFAAQLLVLVSGPIRRHLWKAAVADAVCLALIVVLSVWLLRPQSVESAGWAFLLRRIWLRRALAGICFFLVLLLLGQFATSDIAVFLLFPSLVR